MREPGASEAACEYGALLTESVPVVHTSFLMLPFMRGWQRSLERVYLTYGLSPVDPRQRIRRDRTIVLFAPLFLL